MSGSAAARAIALFSMTLGVGCAEDARDAPDAGTCPADDLLALAAALPDFPEPLAAGLEGPAPLASDDPDRLVLDPDPSTRGDHAALAVVRAPPDCDATIVPLDALPVPSGPSATRVVGPIDIDPTRAGLLVIGADLAADLEAATWETVVSRLDVRARLLERPSADAFEAALGETCAALAEGGVLVLALAGRGTANAGFVLSASPPAIEHVSYARVDDLLAGRCAHLGAVVWVVDASYFDLAAPGGDAPVMRPDGPPTLVFHASDRSAPDAARATRHGPGLLGQVISDALEPGRDALCAAPERRLETAEVAAFFSDLGASSPGYELHTRRWQTFGVPALARLAAAGTLTPVARDRLQAALARAIPEEPLTLRGILRPADRCDEDADCASCPSTTCTRATCAEGLCRRVPDDGAACDDGDPCTASDTCAATTCRGAPIVCDDDNPCTDEACEPGRGCVPSPRVDGACDDGDPCTHGDACTSSGACVGAPTPCDDADPCTTDRCDPEAPDAIAGCVFTPSNGPCDDGDPCTLADQCRSRVCAGTRRTCSDGNDCTVDRCDPATGQCRFDPLVDLGVCDDGDPCTTLDRCRDGTCQGLAATCDDGLACTVDRCEAGRCVHLPAPGLCRSPDGARCIAVGDRPSDAPCLVCAATDRLETDPLREGGPCDDDGVACTDDVCEAGVCIHRDQPGQCHRPNRECVGVGEPVTDCLLCRGGGVVSAVAEGTACDASGCGGGGRCDGLGICVCR